MGHITHTIDIFSNYLKYFLHPFDANRLAHESRANRVMSEIERSQTQEMTQISLIDFISVSWIFMIVKAMYVMIFLLIGNKASNYLLDNDIISHLLSTGPISLHRFIILATIFEVILFPVLLWFYAKFWGVIINFFCTLFNNDIHGKEEAIEEAVASSMTSHIFLLVPIIGELARYVSAPFFLYAGLRENLKFSKVQSIMILFGPILLFMTFIFVFFIYILLLISMI